jgi:hypothetical protein
MRSEKLPCSPANLVVVELHGIDGAAAESVVLGVGPEDGREKYASVSSFAMYESAIRAAGTMTTS